MPEQSNPKMGYKFEIIIYVKSNYKRSKSLRKDIFFLYIKDIGPIFIKKNYLDI